MIDQKQSPKFPAKSGKPPAKGTPTMDFAQALAALKDGKKVARLEWQHDNHKNVFLILVKGQNSITPNAGTPYAVAIDVPTVSIESHIDKYTGTGTFQPGWMPSQADMLAEDWEDASEYTAALYEGEPEAEKAPEETKAPAPVAQQMQVRSLDDVLDDIHAGVATIHKESGVSSDVTGAVNNMILEKLMPPAPKGKAA
jgi:hypothetical protein